MKRIQVKTISLVLTILAVACNKENSSIDGTTHNNELASAQIIALKASSVTGGDSIYAVNVCDRMSHKDSIDFNSLPAISLEYLDANYSAYIAQKAYAIKDANNVITGYISVIDFNGKPVALTFDASGNFLKVLEQREGRDFKGRGWHTGGFFDDRGGMKHDTLNLAAVPSKIIDAFENNFPADTLLKAFQNKDSSIVLISAGNGLYATVFSASGNLIKRELLPSKKGKPSPVLQTGLQPSVTSYLEATYPNYVFKQAFLISNNNVVLGYVVFIDANATKYAISFDAAGNFAGAVTVH